MWPHAQVRKIIIPVACKAGVEKPIEADAVLVPDQSQAIGKHRRVAERLGQREDPTATASVFYEIATKAMATN